MTSRRSYFQTAWVVNDLEQAVHEWVNRAQIGPFFLLPHSRIDNSVYHGSPVTVDISIAVAQVGPMQIELIEQHGRQSSPFTVELPQAGDLDEDIRYYANQGIVAVFTGLVGDARFAFIDTRSSLGFLTELIQRGSSVEGLFEFVSQAGAEWDGSDPIRSLPSN